MRQWMQVPDRTIALFLVLLASTSGGQATASQELLIKPDTATIESVVARNEAEVLEAQSKAKLGKFGIFKFNLELLEAKGEFFTVTLFGELPATIASFGIHRDPESAFLVGFWTGEINSADDRAAYPLELGITTWAMDEDGTYRFPSPYQTTVDEESNLSITIRPAGTKPDKIVVHSVLGRIYVPNRKTMYFVLPLQNNPDFSIIYEPDPSVFQ